MQWEDPDSSLTSRLRVSELWGVLCLDIKYRLPPASTHQTIIRSISSNNPANWTIFIATTDETKNFLSRSESKIFSHKIEFLLIIGFPVEVENQDQVGKSSIFYYSTCQSSQQPLWQNGNICKHSPLKSYSDCTTHQWEDTDIFCQLLQLKYNFISSCPLSVLL